VPASPRQVGNIFLPPHPCQTSTLGLYRTVRNARWSAYFICLFPFDARPAPCSFFFFLPMSGNHLVISGPQFDGARAAAPQNFTPAGGCGPTLISVIFYSSDSLSPLHPGSSPSLCWTFLSFSVKQGVSHMSARKQFLEIHEAAPGQSFVFPVLAGCLGPPARFLFLLLFKLPLAFCPLFQPPLGHGMSSAPDIRMLIGSHRPGLPPDVLLSPPSLWQHLFSSFFLFFFF